MWLLHMEESDGVMIVNGREYNVPELPQFSVDGCAPRLEQYTSSLDVIFTVTRVKCSVTLSPRLAIA